MIRLLATIFAALFGLAFGSFLNVCLSRWPAGESVVKPGSHCRNCNHTLSWWENLPLLSWIILSGRCRNCKTAITWRYPLVELAVAVLWGIATWQWAGPSFEGFILRASPWAALCLLAFKLVFYWILIALVFLDAENLWLPDRLTLPGTLFGVVKVLFELWLAGRFFILNHGLVFAAVSLFGGILAAAALILLIRWLYKLIRHREGIGLGDAKLMALLAAWLGLPGALLAFALGAVIGAITALALLILPRKPQADAPTWAATKLPLGTFLCIGGIISALWGQPILNAYLHWAGL